MKFVRNGFSLIEVMIAVAIVGMALTPLLILQTTSVGFAKRSWSVYDRVLFAYSNLAKSVFVPQKTEQFSQKKQQFTVQMNSGTPADNSSLAGIPGLQVHRATITYTQRMRKKADMLLAFSYAPEKEES